RVDDLNHVMRPIEQRPEESQSFLGSLALGDVIENRDELSLRWTVYGDVQPLALRLEIEFEGLGNAGRGDSAICLEHFRTQLPDSGNDFAPGLPYHVGQPRQPSERLV